MPDTTKIAMIRVGISIDDESSSISVACKLLQRNEQKRNAVNF